MYQIIRKTDEITGSSPVTTKLSGKEGIGIKMDSAVFKKLFLLATLSMPIHSATASSTTTFETEEQRAIVAEAQRLAEERYQRTQDRISLFRNDIEGTIIPEKSIQMIDPKTGRGDSLGSMTQAIYCFETMTPTGKKSYIVKQYSDEIDPYEQEMLASRKIAEWKALMRAHSVESGIKAPELVDYIAIKKISENGHDVGFMLMQRAYGKTLDQIKDSLDTLSADEAIEMGRNIGQQMGAMTRAFFLNNRSILIHGDNSGGNFTYSKSKKQFYWIDLGMLEETPYTADDKYGKNNYLQREWEQIKDIWWSFFPSKIKSEDISTDEKRADILYKHKVGILAGNAFEDAYREQVQDLPPHASRDRPHQYSFSSKFAWYKENYIKQVIGVFGEQSEDVLRYLGLGVRG